MNTKIKTAVKSNSFVVKQSPRQNYKTILTKTSSSSKYFTSFNFKSRYFDESQIEEEKRMKQPSFFLQEMISLDSTSSFTIKDEPINTQYISSTEQLISSAQQLTDNILELQNRLDNHTE
ncbi:Hypothetical_protein [Hexamita inflata]|uniref:Hypothetical_protein n=1 Tax=Hexamita inflata TaxID=28002 RepID=A0AA86U9V4_9EUKA|nr:Hypothetical protein HINF_LOCUS34529 [Hexamita inflata]